MLDSYLDQVVVVDLRSYFVCIGTLTRLDDAFLEMHNADFHDLRDTQTSRENYIAASIATGVKRNRKWVLLTRAEVAVSSGTPEEFVLADLNDARAKLEEVTGARTPDDVLEAIFSRFCIGK